jgi:tetratricopeptide (TPR) repeat protein
MTALLVARPLIPSEGVSWLGDGQPFNLLWLILVAVFLLWVAVVGVALRPLTVVDVAVAVLVALCVISGLAGSAEGSPRFVMNMIWEWVALGLVFVLTRQLVRSRAEARALVAIMIALAVAMSLYGFYQVFVTLPADRAAYAENPDEVLRAAGQWYPPGSPERDRFEHRLASTEPLATFALTNSLAGFLAAWLIMLLGIGLSIVEAHWRGKSNSAEGASKSGLSWLAQLAALLMCALLIGGCFLLTKSRSGYVALALGAVLLPACVTNVRRVLGWRTALVAGLVVAVLVGIGVATGGLDAAVLTEAKKSLGYRLEYWQSTLAMIRNHPLLGVGPGCFQDYYTQYKLPEASEEIRDPHNFLLEIWATSGTLAMIAMCAALGGLMWRACRPQQGEPEAPSSIDNVPLRGAQFMLGGAAVGVALAFLVGALVSMVFTEQQVIGALVVGAVVLAILWPWIKGGVLPPRLPVLGLLVLAVHLLASGGITYPGVAYTFWALAALSLNQAEPVLETASTTSQLSARARLAFCGTAAAGCAAAWACFYFACAPVIRSQTAIAKAEEARLNNQNPFAMRVFWKDAADADPWAPDPWAALAELELARLLRNPTDETAKRRLSNAADQLAQVRSHSSAVNRQIGRWFVQLFEVDKDPDTIKAAVNFYRKAVSYYPTLPVLRAEYADALSQAGQTKNARREAATALRLDSQTPHADKKLPPELKQKLEALAGSQDDASEAPADPASR